MEPLELFGVAIPAWIFAIIIFCVWLVFWLFVKSIFFSRLRKMAENTKTRIDDVLITAINFPLKLLIVVTGVGFINQFVPLEDIRLFNLGEVGLIVKVLTVIAILLFVDRLLKGLIVNYADRNEVLRGSQTIAKGLTSIVIYSLGALILLDSFGVSITPLLASLGVGSLAVALALQPTLENFFAGMQLLTDKPIQVGHFVKLDSGEEGYIEKIGWRSTWLKMLPNNVVVIPNKTLIGSRVLNHYYPSKDMAVLVQCGVHYDSDLEKVEKVTVEVATEIMKTVEGGVPDFEPFIRFHTFDSSSINFSVIMRCQEFVSNYLIKHEFIKALKKRYDQEGIVIPFPITALNLSQEGAETALKRS